ncbi:hypothetical protein [Paeniglutamicibacter gangotriensis]|uniref:Uncharacterized protein n=1 Tax=Paeniglutamicibacter gangotriensis Lz1y TaxID=1276920 RepID=M7MQZ6_9MICC|nr:hypothetical protein [Paeniglutamicibacter gangotriensis]EMQ97345.1 hypothetical protein ADIAG_03140 [Paeniglutamicibacter gangotriensis Lz1y]
MKDSNSKDEMSRISNSTDSGARALWNISRNSKGAILNRGLLLGLALLGLSALVMSDFQPQVALTILRHSPWMTVLVGTLVNLMPLVVPVAGLVFLVLGAMKMCTSEYSDGAFKMLASFLLFVAGWLVIDRNLILSPTLMIPIFGVTTIISVVIGAKCGYSESVEQLAGIVVLSTFAISLLFLFGNPAVPNSMARPYVAAEEINTVTGTDEPARLIGYVLDVDPSGRWTTVLLEGNRQIEILESSNIVERTVCEPTSTSKYKPWWPLLTSQSAAIPVLRCNIS